MHRKLGAESIWFYENEDKITFKVSNLQACRPAWQEDKSVEFTNIAMDCKYFSSPEQDQGLEYTEKCDIWALGCLLYYCRVGTYPFQGIKDSKLQYNRDKLFAGKNFSDLEK